MRATLPTGRVSPGARRTPAVWTDAAGAGRGCQCAPAPVRERTSSSANFSSFFSRDVTVPTAARRKPSGMEISPGLLNGMGAAVVQLNSAVGLLTAVEVSGTPQSAAWAAVSFAGASALLEPPQQIGDSSTTSTAENRPP